MAETTSAEGPPAAEGVSAPSTSVSDVRNTNTGNPECEKILGELRDQRRGQCEGDDAPTLPAENPSSAPKQAKKAAADQTEDELATLRTRMAGGISIDESSMVAFPIVQSLMGQGATHPDLKAPKPKPKAKAKPKASREPKQPKAKAKSRVRGAGAGKR